LHDKSKNIAANSAAKALKDLSARTYGKGSCFFIMKRTQPDVVGTSLLHTHIAGNHIDNVVFLSDLFYELFRIIHLCFLSSMPCLGDKQFLIFADRKTIRHGSYIVADNLFFGASVPVHQLDRLGSLSK